MAVEMRAAVRVGWFVPRIIAGPTLRCLCFGLPTICGGGALARAGGMCCCGGDVDMVVALSPVGSCCLGSRFLLQWAGQDTCAAESSATPSGPALP